MRQAFDSQEHLSVGRGWFGEPRQHFAYSPTLRPGTGLVGGRRWRRLSVSMLALAVLALVASCDAGGGPPSGRQAAADDVLHTMIWVLDPAADVSWGSAGCVITEAGSEDLAPATEAGWARVRHSAAVVAASGNLLLLPEAQPAAADQRPAWTEFAGGMVGIAQQAEQAAADQDAEALFAAGGRLYNVCVACHQVFDRPDAQAP